MIRQLLLTFFSLSLTISAFAQMPESVHFTGKIGTAKPLAKVACSDSNVGTINLQNFSGQSNDFNDQTQIFMCLGDAYEVAQTAVPNLGGDPQLSTTAGVTYGFYSGIPTIDGPNLATVQTDAALIPNPNPPVDGAPFFVSGSTGDVFGNLPLQNTGALQNFFASGAPLQLWFAPLTIDNFATNGYEDDPITNESGPCLTVGVDQYFSIVFLNEVTISNININECDGSFEVSGGLPEFETSNTYDNITIQLVGSPGVTGTVTSGAATHGDIVSFSVPQAGNYEIIVEDDKSCGATTTVTFNTPSPLILSASTETVPPGSAVCVDVVAEDGFDDIVSMQFTIDYDESVLEFSSFTNYNPNLIGLNSSVNNSPADNILVSWFDPDLGGESLSDGSILFEICYTVIGTGGDVSSIVFDGSDISVEITNDCGAPNNPGNVPLDPIPGEVEVTVEAFGVNIDEQDVSCFGANDGAITITTTGGQVPVSISWTGTNTGTTGTATINVDGDSFTAMNLPPDAYNIVVTDNLGSVVNETASIEEGLSVSVLLDGDSPTCPGDCDGTLTALVSLNGVQVNNPGPEYTFQWSDPTFSGDVIPNLCGGITNYGVTVTGPNSCSNSASGSLSSPAPIDPNAIVTNAYCNGVDDGSIQLNITGGSGTYDIDWIVPDLNDEPEITFLTSQSPGIKVVEIQDTNGCIDTFNIEVDAVKSIDLNETIVGIDCNGDDDGSISILASTSGGTSNSYTFFWVGNPTPPAANTVGNMSTISPLSPGTYTVNVTDDEGCQADNLGSSFNLEEPDALVVTELEVTNESCSVGNDGSITIGVTGGTYPYSYQWVGQTDTDSIINGLSAGMYEVIVTDALSCTNNLFVNVSAPQPPTVSVADDQVNCSDSEDGTLTVVYTPGGSPITSVQWSTGSTDDTVTDLAPGQYSVTVTAEDGCFTVETAEVIAPAPLSLVSITTDPTNCPGQGGGFASVNITGGTTPYFFQWSSNAATSGSNPLTGGDVFAGTYSVTVNDVNMCGELVINDIVIPEPPSISGEFTGIEGVSCFGAAGVPPDGNATVTPFYENDPGNTQGQTWNISWQTLAPDPNDVIVFQADNGVLSSSADNLPQETQYVIISDGQCADTLSVDIPTPPPLVALGQSESVSCFGDTDGSVTVTAEGGTFPYSYQWSTGDVDVTTVQPLPPGEVTVLITDANGCNFTLAAEVGEPDVFEIIVNNETADSVSCFGGSDALLSVSTAGGNPGVITYDWQDGIADSNESIATDVGPGSWSVMATDEKGCTAETTFLVSQPDPVTFEYSVDTIQCFGDNVQIRIDTVIGGTAANYADYSWRLNINPPQTFVSVFQSQNIPAGDYIISAFDANECEVSDTFTLTQPNQVIVDLPEVIEIELGDTTTQLSPVIVNDFPLDSIIWTPGAGLSNDTILNPFVRNSTDDVTYTLEIFDVNGCSASDAVFVEIDRNRNIYIPNVFSPNSDGYNDEFGVFGCLGVERIVSGMIFDRWGEQIVSTPTDGLLPECLSPNGTVIWDGTFRGKPAADGVYVYVIDVLFLDGTRLVYRGDITLLK